MYRVKPITPTMLVRSLLQAPEIQFAKVCFFGGFSFVMERSKALPQITNMELVKAVWLLSHFACVCGFLTFTWRDSHMWYYVSICGALFTYTISMVRHILVMVQGNLVMREEIPLAAVLNAENTLLLVTALLHMTSSPNALKLFPFAIFSYMNVISYVLHELISANSFTTALFPILSCIEPVLMGMACFADYSVQFLYYREYVRGETSLLYGLIFSYISFKRLERSELARASLYSLFDMTYTVLLRVRAPLFMLRAFSAYRNAVYFLVPIDSVEHVHDITRKASVKTRATSIFFEPILIVNDLN